MVRAGFIAGLAGRRIAGGAAATGWMRRWDNASSGDARGRRLLNSAAFVASIRARSFTRSCTTNGHTTGPWSRIWNTSETKADRRGWPLRRNSGPVPTAAPRPSGFRSPAIAASPWRPGTCRRADTLRWNVDSRPRSGRGQALRGNDMRAALAISHPLRDTQSAYPR